MARTNIIQRGPSYTRPAAGTPNRIYVTTDAPQRIYMDNGATWDRISQLLPDTASPENLFINAAGYGVVADYNTSTNTGTDNAPYINTAIADAALLNIKRVELPPGNIGINSPIIFQSGVKLIGRGNMLSGGAAEGTVLYRMSAVTMLQGIGTSIRVSSNAQLRSIGVEDMRIDGRGLAADICDFAAAKDVYFSNVFLRDTSQRAIRMREVFDSRLDRLSVEFAGDSAGTYPAIALESNTAIPGDPSSRNYEITNQVHFRSLRMESFPGVAIRTEGTSTNEIFFMNAKFESAASAQPHVKFVDGANAFFNGVTFTAQGSNSPAGAITPGVVWFNNWDGVAGQMMVEHIGTVGTTAAAPAAFMRIENSSERFDLDFVMGVGGTNITSSTVITDNDEAWDSRNIRGSSGITTKPLYGRRRRQAWGTAAPTQTFHGKWNAGDQLWNSAPTVGQPIGWVCTAAGTPGTWRALANLA